MRPTMLYTRDNLNILRLTAPIGLTYEKASYWLHNAPALDGCNSIALVGENVKCCFMKHDLLSNYLDIEGWQSEQDDWKKFWFAKMTPKEQVYLQHTMEGLL